MYLVITHVVLYLAYVSLVSLVVWLTDGTYLAGLVLTNPARFGLDLVRIFGQQ